ncbi:MAG: sel1 repeat family protein [Proteobacteria bacterium]|nr:sel1 repeat family protein [Pseudomonadota bacterium]
MPPRLLLPLLALALATLTPPALANPGRFCGGPVQTSTPDDLANVVGDQSLEYAAQQPASMLTCARGYLLAKCGDFETANQVFDKCIAAGYAGAMIWKALLLEDGNGVERDLAQAAALLHRAAVSGDPAYGPLGKMHYATMLHQGKGVPRDEAAALDWFRAAAAEGNAEAREFLRSGYHTGARDRSGMGAGTPTAQALAAGQWETGTPPAARPREAAAESPPHVPDAAVRGQKLLPFAAQPPAVRLAAPWFFAALLLAVFLAGLLTQARRRGAGLPAGSRP